MTIRVDPQGSQEYPESLYRFDRTAVTVQDLASIGAAELQLYRQQGYLAVERGLSPAEVESALCGLGEVIDDPAPGVSLQLESWAESDPAETGGRLDAVRRLMSFAGSNEPLAGLAAHPAIMAVVREIIGKTDVRMFQDMALLKPPGGGREKPWHQDKAYFNLDLDAPVVGVWIALDAATAENGCMHVIPRSHLGGAMPHFSRRDWQICDSDVGGEDVVVPLPPGGLLLFDGYLHHGTPANRTDTRRRALQFHYAPADIVEISEHQRLTTFGAEGQGAEC